MSDVSVKFGADTGEFDAGAEDVRGGIGSIDALIKGLVDAFAILGGAATGSFREIRTGAADAGRQIKETSEKIKEFRTGIAELGEAVLAAFAVEQITEFARRMGEVAEANYHTALTFGITTGQVQEFNAQMKALGIAPEAAIAAFPRLDRAITNARDGNKQLQQTFKDLGVDISQPIGQVDLFRKTLAGLANIPDIATRAGEAVRVLGRNILEIAPLIGITKEQIAEANALIEEYGAKDDVAAARGLALAESFNTNKVAMQGLNNVLTDALAPAFKVLVDGVNGLVKSFIDSYREGGLVKGIFDALTATLQLLITVVATAWSGFQQFFEFLEAGWYDIMAIGSAAGVILYDAMTGRGGQAARDGEAAFQHWHDKAVQALADVAKETAKWQAYMKEVWSPPKVPDLPKPVPNAADVNVKTKVTGQESALDKLKDELAALEATHDGIIHDMQVKELAFWKDVANGPKMATLSQKEQAQVTREIKRLEHEQDVSQIRQTMAEEKDAAANAVQDAKDEYTRKRELIEQGIADIRDAEKNRLVTHEQASARIGALIVQEREAAKAAAKAELDARVLADQQIMAQSERGTAEYKAALRDEENAYRTFNKDIVAADAAAQKQLADQHRRTVDQLRQQWHGYIDPVVQATGSAFKGMLTGAKTLQQGLAAIGESILDVFISIGERMVESWIVNMVLGKTIQGATGVAQVMSNAAVAASAAFASTAAIPIVGPELAPAAAAAAFAATAAWAPLASAARGWGEIPEDQLAMVHKKEMILPADIASPLRSALAGGSLGLPSSGGLQAAAIKAGADTRTAIGHQGDINLTHAPTVSGVGSSNVVDHLSAQSREFKKFLQRLIRDNPGSLKTAKAVFG